MGVAENALLANRLREELSGALERYGLVPNVPDDPEWSGWYAVERSGIPNVVAAVGYGLWEHHYGGIALSGIASVRSFRANEILREIPEDAWLIFDDDADLKFGHIDSIRFGDFQNPPYSALVELVGTERNIDQAVRWFMGFVVGPVHDWLAARDSLDKLIAIARVPNPDSGGKINPTRFRGVVATCVSVDRFDDAATLMRWYIARENFNRLDSIERARAMDEALAERFPRYRAARESLTL